MTAADPSLRRLSYPLKPRPFSEPSDFYLLPLSAISTSGTGSEGKIPAPRGGSRWGRSTITRILRDTALKGEFYHGYERMEAPSFYEATQRKQSSPELIYVDKPNAILTDDVWAAIQKRLDENIELARRNTRRDYGPLHRLVECAACDRKCNVDPGKGWPAFRCPECRARWSVATTWEWARDQLIDLWCAPQTLRQAWRRHLDSDEARIQLEQRRTELAETLGHLRDEEVRAIRLSVAYPEHEATLDDVLGGIKKRRRDIQMEYDQCGRQLAAIRTREALEADFEGVSARMTDAIRSWGTHDWRAFLRGAGFRLLMKVPVVENDVMDWYFPTDSRVSTGTAELLSWPQEPAAILHFDRVLTSAFVASQPS